MNCKSFKTNLCQPNMSNTTCIVILHPSHLYTQLNNYMNSYVLSAIRLHRMHGRLKSISLT